jgi:hypothetical protein
MIGSACNSDGEINKYKFVMVKAFGKWPVGQALMLEVLNLLAALPRSWLFESVFAANITLGFTSVAIIVYVYLSELTL